MLRSKTREGAFNYSRKASLIELNQANLPLGQIGGTTKVGSPTVDQLGLGFELASVQSAIDDVVNSYQVPVNGVVILNEPSQTPTGVHMIERLEINGVAQESIVYVYGIPVKVEIEESNVAITTKVIATLNSYKDKGIAIRDVQAVAGVNNQVDVTFTDTNPHDNYFYDENGVVIAGSTSTAAVPGYGTWAKIGESEITLTGSTAKTTLYYFKRTA